MFHSSLSPAVVGLQTEGDGDMSICTETQGSLLSTTVVAATEGSQEPATYVGVSCVCMKARSPAGQRTCSGLCIGLP